MNASDIAEIGKAIKVSFEGGMILMFCLGLFAFLGGVLVGYGLERKKYD